MSIKFNQTIAFSTAVKLPVSHVLLAIGSNYNANIHLAYAQKQLYKLGTVIFSDAFVNPDFTATASNPKPDYTNQCAILTLNQVTELGDIVDILKAIEVDCKRDNVSNKSSDVIKDVIKLVSLDIDVLGINQKESGEAENIEWTAIAKRYPFKEHEWTGIKELF